MQVEAAAVAVHVQHLSGGEQAGYQAGFQRIRIEALQLRAAAGDLGLIEAQRGLHRKRPAGKRALDGGSLLRVQLPGQHRQRPHSGGLDQHLTQPLGHDAAEEVVQRALWQQLCAAVDGVLRRIRPEVQFQRAGPSLLQIDSAGQLHRGDAGHAALAEENLANLPAQQPVFAVKLQLPVHADALERAHSLGIGLERRNGGQARGDPVAEALQNMIAVGAAAQLGRSHAATGHQHAVRLHPAAILRGDFKATALPHGRNLEFGHDLAAVLRGVEPQAVQHPRRSVAQGIDPAFAIGCARHADGGKEVHRIPWGEGGERGLHIARVAVVVPLACFQVGQIAAAISGGEQLPAHPALLLQQDGPQPPPGQQARGHQPRSAAADDCNAHVPHS